MYGEMYWKGNFVIISAFGLAGLVNLASGLKCYMCLGGSLNNFPIPLPGFPEFPFHEYCGGGGKLPDTHLVECDRNNTIIDTTINNLTGAKESPSTMQTSLQTVCFKQSGTFGIDENEAHLKGCFLRYTDGIDDCEKGIILPGVSGVGCLCHRDGCNAGCIRASGIVVAVAVAVFSLVIRNIWQ